jgi:hypothetical protein
MFVPNRSLVLTGGEVRRPPRLGRRMMLGMPRGTAGSRTGPARCGSSSTSGTRSSRGPPGGERRGPRGRPDALPCVRSVHRGVQGRHPHLPGREKGHPPHQGVARRTPAQWAGRERDRVLQKRWLPVLAYRGHLSSEVSRSWLERLSLNSGHYSAIAPNMHRSSRTVPLSNADFRTGISALELSGEFEVEPASVPPGASF